MENNINRTIKIGPTPFISVDYCGGGKGVIFLHGIGGNKRNWDDNVIAFSKFFKVVSLDTRGYGDSDDYEGEFSYSDVAKDLLKVINFFNFTKVHLVGLSMGARIAGWFYNLYPKRVNSLVLCDTHLGFSDFSSEKRLKFIELRSKPLLAGKSPQEIAPNISRSLLGDPNDKRAFNKLVDSLGKLRKENYIKTIKAFTLDDNADLFKSINVPCLVLAGELDTLTPPHLARKIANQIKGSKCVIIKKAGHLPNIEKAKEFNEAVLNFLLGLTKND